MLSKTLHSCFVVETNNFAEIMKIYEWKWNPDIERGLIMDVGVGSSEISYDFISQSYINARKIHIDNNPEIIRFFKKKKNSTYENIDIADWDLVKNFEGVLSKVVSLRCLEEVENQRAAFKNIFRLLKPGGDILVLMTISSYFYDLVDTVIQRDCYWRRYFKDKYSIPVSHKRGLDSDHYRGLLLSIGFEEINIKEMPRKVTYKNTQDFKDDVYHSSLCRFVPEVYRQEFTQEVYLCAETNIIKNDPLACLEITYNTLWIHAVKKEFRHVNKRPYPE